jgi:prepilin-type N-terminal cleavage/methylation domain-containing protein
VNRPTPRRSRLGDAGFTLIELVVTIVIMGIVLVPLADFLIQYLHSYTQTQQRLSDSHDLQILAVYFSADVANTGLRNQTSGQTTFAPQQSIWTTGISTTFCGATIAGTPILKLSWDAESVGSGAGSDTINSAEYVVNAGTLHREFCSQPASGAATLAPDATVVHNLSGTPAVTCSSTCTAGTPPLTVTLTLTVQGGATDNAGTPVSLTGQRRQAAS